MQYPRSFLAAVIVATSLFTTNAQAVPVLDYSGSSSPGIGLEINSGGEFETAGGLAVSSLLNWANFLPALDGIASISITDVALVGTVVGVGPGVFSQATSGGRLEAFDAAANLLLSVDFTLGQLLLTSIGTGSQFTVASSTFGGPLAAYLVPSSATHSISLVNWSPVGFTPFSGGVRFADSSGFGNGLVAGEPVPEPATLFLLGSGLFGALGVRRRSV